MRQVVGLPNNSCLSPIRRGFVPGFLHYKKGCTRLEPQVIQFTSCLPMVGGSLRVLRLLPPLKLVAMIQLKVALNTINQISQIFWFQKGMIARYFSKNNMSEYSRVLRNFGIKIFCNPVVSCHTYCSSCSKKVCLLGNLKKIIIITGLRAFLIYHTSSWISKKLTLHILKKSLKIPKG